MIQHTFMHVCYLSDADSDTVGVKSESGKNKPDLDSEHYSI